MSAMASSLPPDNKRVEKYEAALDTHVRKVHVELEEQIKKLQGLLKDESNAENDLSKEAKFLDGEVRKLRRTLGVQQRSATDVTKQHSTTTTKYGSADARLQELRRTLQTEMKRERDLRAGVNETNTKISEASNQLDTIVWPERNDVKTMNVIVSRSTTDRAEKQRQKNAQDAYIERLRWDVKVAESELQALASNGSVLKRKIDDERNRFITLQDRLRTFQSGTLKQDDHFKNLVNSTNGGYERDVSHATEASQGKLLAVTETENQDIRSTNHQRQSTLEETRKKAEAERTRTRALKQELSRVKSDCDHLRVEKGIPTGEGSDDREKQLQQIQQELMEAKQQLNLERDQLTTVDNLSRKLRLTRGRRRNVDVNSNGQLLAATTIKNVGNYSVMRDTITELVRKKIALQYRLERLNQQIAQQQPKFNESRRKMEESARELSEAEHTKATWIPGGEAQSMEAESGEDPEAVMNEAVSKQLSKTRTFEEDERRIRAEIQELRELGAKWKSKAGEFQGLETIGERHVACLNEVRSLQKEHQSMERELWRIQKELEFTVMRRDYAVNRAHTVLGTHNQTRSQRLRDNEELKKDIAELQKRINEAANEARTISA